MQSAELKLKHSVHNAAQCTEISVHSVLSAFGIGVFHTALESALCTVRGVDLGISTVTRAIGLCTDHALYS